MKNKNLAALSLLFSMSCTGGQTSRIESNKQQQNVPVKDVERAPAENRQETDLVREIEQIAKDSGGRVGVAAAIQGNRRNGFPESQRAFPDVERLQTADRNDGSQPK